MGQRYIIFQKLWRLSELTCLKAASPWGGKGDGSRRWVSVHVGLAQSGPDQVRDPSAFISFFSSVSRTSAGLELPSATHSQNCPPILLTVQMFLFIRSNSPRPNGSLFFSPLRSWQVYPPSRVE